MTILRVPEELTEPGYRDTWRKRSDLPVPPDGAPALVPREPDPMEEALRAGRRYRDLLDARSKALRALRDHGAALDANAKPEEMAAARFRARAKELRRELGSRLGPSTRGLFERDFDRIAEPMAAGLAQRARTREIAGFKAALEEHQATLRNLAMDESTKALAGEARRQGLYEYERAAQLGVIADAEAGRRSFLDELQAAAAGRDETGETSERDASHRAATPEHQKMEQAAAPTLPADEELARRRPFHGPYLPAVPKYRKDVSKVTSNWSAFDTVLRKEFGDDHEGRLSALRRFAAEGGMDKYPRPNSTTYAGITQAALDHLKDAHGDDERVRALPRRTTQLNLGQVALIYRRYPDLALRPMGGAKALREAVGPATADAVLDTVFMHGADGSKDIFPPAIEATIKKLPATEKTAILPNGAEALKGRPGPNVRHALEQIERKGLGQAFRENLAAERRALAEKSARDRHADEIKKNPNARYREPVGEYMRIDHFIDPWQHSG